jgi:hypothetical protein
MSALHVPGRFRNDISEEECRWYYFAIALISAILFTAYLIYDLQLLMGGRKYEISPDEYIAASISIYLDIVQIFLNILQIIGLVD